MKTLVLWLLAVLAVSVMPLEGRQMLFPYADKVLHFFIYAVTSAFFIISMRGPLMKKGLTFGGVVVVSVLLSSAYGLMLEGLQQFVPGRSFSFFDALSNTLGSATGAAYIVTLVRKKK